MQFDLKRYFSNEVWFWGEGKTGQTGVLDKKRKRQPILVPKLNEIGILQVSCGGTHCAGVTAKGDLYVWGNGTTGCLGRGDFLTLTVPRKVLQIDKVLQVACGLNHTCFLTFEKKMFSTGNNDYGQLGIGNTTSACIPQLISGLEGVVISKIICGPNQSACIDEGGAFYCWGDSRNGQTCHISRFNELSPKRVEVFSKIAIEDVGFGENHGACLSKENEVYFWGYSLIDFGAYDCLEPVRINLEGIKIIQIACGNYHICMLSEEGGVYTMGCNLHGQLGIGNKENKYSPIFVNGLSDIAQISCGKSHNLALSKDGKLFGWGDNSKFQLTSAAIPITNRKDFLSPCHISVYWVKPIVHVFSGGDTSGVIISTQGTNVSENNTSLLHQTRLISISHPTETEKLSVLVCSWNVNAKPVGDLDSWFSSPVPPDIVAIGLQEIIQLTSHSLAKDQINSLAMQEDLVTKQWRGNILIALNSLYSDCEYSILKDQRLAGLYICIVVHKRIKEKVSELQATGIAVGVLGKIANKGGIAVRFSIYEETFCFVTSHLAAGQSNTEKRNNDYKTIASNTRFEFPEKNLSFSIFDHKNIFWFGDLNYRVDLPRNNIDSLVAQKDWSNLLKFDQLYSERLKRRVFEGFKESRVVFQPTYKYDVGTQNFDTSEKMRRPAWCDRILYRGSMRAAFYSSHPSYVSSDHKPISALFGIQLVKSSLSEYIQLRLHEKIEDKLGPSKWKRPEFIDLRPKIADQDSFIGSPRASFPNMSRHLNLKDNGNNITSNNNNSNIRDDNEDSRIHSVSNPLLSAEDAECDNEDDTNDCNIFIIEDDEEIDIDDRDNQMTQLSARLPKSESLHSNLVRNNVDRRGTVSHLSSSSEPRALNIPVVPPIWRFNSDKPASIDKNSKNSKSFESFQRSRSNCKSSSQNSLNANENTSNAPLSSEDTEKINNINSNNSNNNGNNNMDVNNDKHSSGEQLGRSHSAKKEKDSEKKHRRTNSSMSDRDPLVDNTNNTELEPVYVKGRNLRRSSSEVNLGNLDIIYRKPPPVPPLKKDESKSKTPFVLSNYRSSSNNNKM